MLFVIVGVPVILARRSHQRSLLDWALLSGPATPVPDSSRHNASAVPAASSRPHPDVPKAPPRHANAPPLSHLPRVGHVVPPKPAPHLADLDKYSGRRTSMGLPLLDDDFLGLLDSSPEKRVQTPGDSIGSLQSGSARA